jgi:hypothetical protein
MSFERSAIDLLGPETNSKTLAMLKRADPISAPPLHAE